MKLCECGCGSPAPLAQKADVRRGYVKGGPMRFVIGHQGRKRDNYVPVDHGHESFCWIWQGALLDGRYGRLDLDGRKVMAHRAYWEAQNGPVPDGLELDHLCRQTACVNPDHLEAVTHAENVRRGALAKLTMEQARAIREMEGPDKQIAARFGVSDATVWCIRNERNWVEA